MRITATLLDGTKYSCLDKHYMSTGDRVAFEHQFELSTAALSKFKEAFNDDGTVVPGADLGAFREEWTVFFCWRSLRRAGQDVGNYDTFVDNLDELSIKDPDRKRRSEDTEPDPNLSATAAQAT